MLDNDRSSPIKAQDKLGFGSFADHLANSIAAQPAPKGFVFGIEGAWGSGKSFLVSLTKKRLSELAEANTVSIEFAPWLVGSRDALARELLAKLSDGAAEASDAVERRALIGKSFARFTSAVSSAAAGGAKFAKLASAAGVVGADSVANVLQSTSDAFAGTKAAASLEEAKETLCADLANLKKRIVVFIDDVDRLTPQEAAEMFRLVKSVADFPNVIYVLSYDLGALTHTLSESINSPKGQRPSAYIEKFVQLAVSVPPPEPFALRQWLRSEVDAHFPPPLRDPSKPHDGSLSRRVELLDRLGGEYLRSPRDVVRTLNSIVFHGLPIKGAIDVGDLAALHLIKVNHGALYDWIKDYVSEVATITRGASETDGDAEMLLERLDALLPSEDQARRRSLYTLGEMLPPLSRLAMNIPGEKRKLALHLGQREAGAMVRGKRLLSPDHWRMYFSLQPSRDDISDAKFAFLLSISTENTEAFDAEIAMLATAPVATGRTLLDNFLFRVGLLIDQISDATLARIVASLANHIDARAKPGWWAIGWSETDSLLLELRRRSAISGIKLPIAELFGRGASVSWLASIIQTESWARGLCGSEVTPDRERLLSDDDFETARASFHARLQAISLDEIVRARSVIPILFAWSQSGDGQSCIRWVAENTRSDDDMLRFLKAAGEPVVSSAQNGLLLRAGELGKFMDVSEIQQRLGAIAAGDDGTSELAKRILKAIVDE